MFALLFFFRQRWDDVSRERLATTAAKAEEGTIRVEALVRTMPPRAFQAQLAQMIAGAHRGLAKTLPRQRRPDMTADDLIAFIRSLLNSIARLALIYDDQPLSPDGAVTYSANIMLFVARPIDSNWPTGTVERLRFYSDDSDPDQLRGVLVLRPELSATSNIADIPDPDPGVPAIALPVPIEAKRGSRWVALPGAPKAFLTDSIDGYDDAVTLSDWCLKSGDFRPSVVDDLRHYFTDGDGKTVRSFISRPLHGLNGDTLGVLNLHSNQTNILGDVDERMPAFQAMLTPIFLDLQSAVEILLQTEAGVRAGLAPPGN